MTTHKLLITLFFLLSLGACGGGGGGDDTPPPASGTINVSIADAIAAEGDSASAELVFAVSLSAAAASDVSVDFATADGTADQNDYASASGTLTIPAGQTSGEVRVVINGDTDIEIDEDFTVGLTNPVNANLGNAVAVGQIENDDFPLLSVATGSVVEGNNGAATLRFDVTLDRAGIADITVDYATSDVIAIAGDDYTAASDTLTLAVGNTTATIDIDVSGDTNIETDEQFIVNLLNASSNARIAVDEAVGVIINDDFPRVSIGPANVTEGDSGTQQLSMPLTLDAPATADVVVDYATADGSATAGSDYVAANGSVTVPAGDVSASIDIDALGDTLVENSETVQVSLTGLQGPAILGLASANGTILDDDGAAAEPQLSANAAAVAEGDAGSTSLDFLVVLDRSTGSDVNFDYATVDGTALAGQDYVAATGTATISAGSTSTTVTVVVNGDTDEESDENLTLNLSNVSAGITLLTPAVNGSIVDDDTPVVTPPRVSIADAAVLEGDSGTVTLEFAVTLDQAATDAVSADYATEELSAIAGVDYESASGVVNFPAGSTAASISVVVNGDTFSEDDETLRVRLSNLVGDASFARSLATGTILTDEPLVRLSISDTGAEEGDAGTTEQVFTVSLNIAATNPISFDFATADGTAISGEDYIGAVGALQIAAGDLSVDIPVSINGDSENEPDETYTLALSNVSLNAVVLDDSALGVVVNDDGSPGWQPAQVIGNGREHVDVAVDSAGNAAVVFAGPTSSATFRNPVLVALLTNGAWGSPTEVATFAHGPQREPLIATLGGGGFVTAWVDADGVNSADYTPATGWNAQNVSLDGGFYLTLDGNESGEAITAWEGFGNNFAPSDIYRSSFGAAAWDVAELGESDDTGHARRPFSAIDDDGNRAVYWSQTYSDSSLSGNYIDYFDVATGTWTGPAQIPELLFASNVNVAMLGGGIFAVAAQIRGFANNFDTVELWLYNSGLATWSSAGAFDLATSDATLPEVAVDDNGNIFVAWFEQPTSGTYDVYVNRFDQSGGGWGSPVALENTIGSAWPIDGGLDLSVDAAGNAIVVWSQNIAPPGEFDYRIRASRYSANDGSWSPPEQIDDGDKNVAAFGPKIGMDAGGNAVVAWFYDNTGELGAARYVAP